MEVLTPCYADDACEIYFNVTRNAVQTRWKGVFVSGVKLYRILDEIIKELKERQCSIIIADAREMKVIGEEDQKWIVESWYPRAVKAGFQFEILVVSPSTFSEVTINKIVDHYDDKKVKTVFVTSMNDAMAWAAAAHQVQKNMQPWKQL